MTTAPQVRLTGRAARFVQLLQDFGHVDEERLARLLMALASSEGEPERVADLEEVRREAAAMLFETSGGDIDGILAEDWTLLFS